MIDICYYSSDYYSPYTGISMYSLLKNNQDLDFSLHCIDSGISAENKAKMSKMASEFGKRLVFHDYSIFESFIRDELKMPICSGSYATYIKVFPEKILGDCEKILFIDGDTIVNGSLRELFKTDMEEKVFAAAKVSLINENWVYEENRPDNLRLQYSLKFHDFAYFNVGVFLVNLKKWVQIDFAREIMKAAEEHLDIISRVDDIPIDEMLINLAALKLENRRYVLALSGIYNCVAHSMPFQRALKVSRRCGYIDEDDFREAYYHPAIIHFCNFKPWCDDAYSRYYPLLRRYRAESPWPEAFTERKYKSIPQKVFRYCFYPMQSEAVIRTAKRLWDGLRIWE